jgi:hypothetical protein
MNFREALPRLAAAYDQGILVPFLGAGMSRPACPDWPGLISGLEKQAKIECQDGTAAHDLVRRGNRAVRVLRRQGEGTLISAMRKALYKASGDTPAQTAALVRIWWPLVLTTNYDDHFARAYRKQHPDPRDALTIVGRSAQDCQQVLSSLSSASAGMLWALQGYMPRAGDHRLHGELVVGHEEYRRVTHTAQHFRRAFAEVFRRRSLLFLGSSLGDAYLLDLFGEILEFSGANPMPHYAMVERGRVDAPFLRSRFNIIALEYESHDEVPEWLDALRAELDRARFRPMRWSFSLDLAAVPGESGGAEDLEIIRGPLRDPAPGEVLAVSAGTAAGGVLWVGQKVYPLAQRHWPPSLPGGGFTMEKLGERFVFGYRNPDGSPIPVVAVNARVDEHDRRDLRLIGDAVLELLSWAAEQGYSCVRMQVLASGRRAHYPARFSLAEAIRAYGRWRRRTRHTTTLKIHLVDPHALLEVATGRLDVVELVCCEDVRFWVEIVDGEHILERELVFADCDQTLGSIAERFDVPRTGWEMEVNPRPRPDARPDSVQDEWESDLLSVGVIPGATLRFISPR